MQAWHFALSSRAINCFFLQCMDSFYIFIPGDKNIKRKTSSWKESDRNDHTQRFFWDLGKVICLSEWYLPRWKDTSGFLGLSLTGQQLLLCWYRGHLWETLGSRWKDSPSAKHSCGSSQTLGSLKKLGSKLCLDVKRFSCIQLIRGAQSFSRKGGSQFSRVKRSPRCFFLFELR